MPCLGQAFPVSQKPKKPEVPFLMKEMEREEDIKVEGIKVEVEEIKIKVEVEGNKIKQTLLLH